MAESKKELIKEIQNICYSMLCDIDKYCADNDLTYYLSGGTCLGAVRNHGFIPWDDDADIMLPRKDYEKFIQNFEQFYKGKYKLATLNTDHQWSKPSARVWDVHTEIVYTKVNMKVGVFVDVFPIDGLPENAIMREIYFIRLRILNILRNAAIRKGFYDYEKYRTLKNFLGILTRPFGARFFAVNMDKIAKKYSYEKSKYVGASLAAHYWGKEAIKKDCMASAIRVPFESGEFPIPVGYKRYLSNLYGDYMKTPEGAEEKGYTHLDGWSVNINNGNV